MSSRLARLRVTSPCPVRWSDRPGEGGDRWCERCEKVVYDLSARAPCEAEALLAAPGPAPCVRFLRRKDGSIVLNLARAAALAALAVGAPAGGEAAAASDRAPAIIVEADDPSIPVGVVDVQVSRADGAPLAGVTIRIAIEGEEEWVAWSTTSLDGQAKLGPLKPGKYQIQIIGPAGFAPFAFNPIVLGSERGVNIRARVAAGASASWGPAPEEEPEYEIVEGGLPGPE